MNLSAARIYFPEDDGREILRTTGELLDSWQFILRKYGKEFEQLAEAGHIKKERS